MSRTASLRMGVGQFFGRFERRRVVGGWSLAAMRPTVPEHEVQHHTHDDAHLLFLIEGEYLSTASGMPVACRDPVVLLNPPGTEHRDRFRGGGGRFLTVSIPAAEWARLVAGLGIEDHAQRLPVTALAAALGLLEELRAWDQASALAVEEAVVELAALAAPDPERAAAPGWLRRAVERVDDDPGHPPRIDELAAIAGVHPVHFARVFRRALGHAPSEHLRQRRLQVALGRIARGARIADVAVDLGFTDQAHFHHWCCRLLRRTPGAIRRLVASDVAFLQEPARGPADAGDPEPTEPTR